MASENGGLLTHGGGVRTPMKCLNEAKQNCGKISNRLLSAFRFTHRWFAWYDLEIGKSEEQSSPFHLPHSAQLNLAAATAIAFSIWILGGRTGAAARPYAAALRRTLDSNLLRITI